MERITHDRPHPLFNQAGTRLIEQAAAAESPPHALMQRAGLAVARLALAVAPHADAMWLACGPGNNGGDGLEAALHLARWGKTAVVTWLGSEAQAPADAVASLQRARAAGVRFSDRPPALGKRDLCIDALLGIGGARAPEGRMLEWIVAMNHSAASVLAVDLPTGLHADTGAVQDYASAVHAQHTLCLLTLKPGLFTGDGRDHAGQVWLDDLQVDTTAASGSANCWLAGLPAVIGRLHASHKGSYGDVAVIGGSYGMTGAALLAARAALHAGAGRVFVALLDAAGDPLSAAPPTGLTVDPSAPELMFRTPTSLKLATMTVVCGCGGGSAVQGILPTVLRDAARLVLDADALNAVAADSALQSLVRARAKRRLPTVMTPHPLEAARLLRCAASEVQADRMAAAQSLSDRFNCAVVLKGSGTVVAAPQQTLFIIPTGNAKLATAGTGDVLAGMIGARLATTKDAFEAACAAAYQHGDFANKWPPGRLMTASELATGLGAQQPAVGS